jgi:hypothetical protein
VPGTLTQSEIDERAAILRRFREALLRQRERFSEYLQMLEQQSPGEDGSGWTNPEQIEIHVKMEEAIVHEIANFGQVVAPLQLMYQEIDPQGAAELPQLQASLERTRDEVLRRTERSRDLLKQQVSALRTEISELRVMRQTRSLYATPEPTTIDISA